MGDIFSSQIYFIQHRMDDFVTRGDRVSMTPQEGLDTVAASMQQNELFLVLPIFLFEPM